MNSSIFELVIRVLLGFPTELKFELLILHLNFFYLNIMAQILHRRLFLRCLLLSLCLELMTDNLSRPLVLLLILVPKVSTARVCCIPCWVLGSFSEKSTLDRYDNRGVVNGRLIRWFLFFIRGADLKVGGFLSGCGRLMIDTWKKVSMAVAWQHWTRVLMQCTTFVTICPD